MFRLTRLFPRLVAVALFPAFDAGFMLLFQVLRVLIGPLRHFYLDVNALGLGLVTISRSFFIFGLFQFGLFR